MFYSLVHLNYRICLSILWLQLQFQIFLSISGGLIHRVCRFFFFLEYNSQWLNESLGGHKWSMWPCTAASCNVLICFVWAMSGTKLMIYKAAFKLKVVEFAETSCNRKVEMEYRVREELVQDWRMKKLELTMLLRSVRSHWVEIWPYSCSCMLVEGSFSVQLMLQQLLNVANFGWVTYAPAIIKCG